MKHPDPKYQKNQEDFLKQCPEEQKEFHERFFRIGNAAFVYHQHATSVPDQVAGKYFQEWLEGLPDNIRRDMQKKGFEACKTMLPFTRYVNERTDIGMDEWMKMHLSNEDYAAWRDMGRSQV